MPDHDVTGRKKSLGNLMICVHDVSKLNLLLPELLLKQEGYLLFGTNTNPGFILTSLERIMKYNIYTITLNFQFKDGQLWLECVKFSIAKTLIQSGAIFMTNKTRLKTCQVLDSYLIKIINSNFYLSHVSYLNIVWKVSCG